jgi:hypothetical protein
MAAWGWKPSNDALVGNNASLAFRERDEDEYPATQHH